MSRTKGRMLTRDISNSVGFSSLSPSAAVLFTMIIPHLNAYGKCNGGVGFIKDEICPLIEYLNYDTIPELLNEINEKTNVKVFSHANRQWIHAINFLKNHQKLPPERMGKDELPNYPEYKADKSVKPRVDRDAYGEHENVYLSKDEVDKLHKSLGVEKTNRLIEAMSGYLEQNGKTYKSYYAALGNWSRMEEERAKKSKQPSKLIEGMAKKYPAHKGIQRLAGK